MDKLEPRLKAVAQDLLGNAASLDNNYYISSDYIEPALYCMVRCNEDWGAHDEKVNESFTASPSYKIAKAINLLMMEGFTDKLELSETAAYFSWDLDLDYVYFSRQAFDEFCNQVKVFLEE